MGNPFIHFEFNAEDGAGLAAFYEQAFGWKTQLISEYDYALVSAKDRRHGVDGGINMGSERPGTTVYIEVPDLEATLATVQKLGGKLGVAAPMDVPNGPRSPRSWNRRATSWGWSRPHMRPM